jgi:hypothetical protein
MAIAQRRDERIGPESTPVKTAIETSKRGALAGWLPTIFSAIAVGASCISVYVSTLQAANLEVYVPPSIQYARDGGGETEVFAIPVTIANSGARSVAVVSMEVEVQNVKTNATKRYASFYLGEHPKDAASTNRQFAPVSIPGRGVFTDTVRFYPIGDALPKLVDDKGDYVFRLKVTTATPQQPSWLDLLLGRTQPAPLTFEMMLPYLSEQHLNNRRGTIAMYSKDWKPAATPGKSP